MMYIINHPVILVTIFVISLYVGNHIYKMGLKKGKGEGIAMGRMQVLEENEIRHDYLEERRNEYFLSRLHAIPLKRGS